MIKTKKILIALAVIGANVLHNMPLHTALAAESDIWWYGTTGGFVDVEPNPAVTTGVNLAITDSTQVNGKMVAEVNKIIYGGYTDGSLDVKNNSIIFSTTNAITIAAEVYGGYSENGNVTNNTVTISNGTFSNKIHGGKTNSNSATTTARGNAVIIDNGTFDGYIFAGFGGAGGVVENSLTINNGTFNANVYGGDAVGSGAAAKNTVTIYDGIFSVTNKPVYGGVSNGGDVTENVVIIKGGTFNGTSIIAGAVLGGSTSNNTGNAVTIEGGIFNNVKLYGGMGGTSSNNELNFKTKMGGTANEVKYFQKMNFTIPTGATSDTVMMRVNNTNAMALSGITFATDLNGLSLTGNDYITLVKNVDGTEGPLAAHTNYYVLDIGGTKELVYSNGMPVAKADFEITTNGVKSAVDSKYYNDGSGSMDAIANTSKTYNHLVQGNVDFTTGAATTNYRNNEIIIRRGTYSSSTAVVGAFNTTTNDELTNNTVSIYDGTIKGAVYGANSTNGAVSGNTVNIYGGTLGESNTINIYGGYSNTNDATGNLTNIEGGTFSASKNNFYGGYSENGKAGGSGENEGNKVIIDNITFGSGTENEIYGGCSGHGDACGNSVIINNGTFNGKIYGGYGDGTVGGDSPESGNKVIINNGTFNGEIYGGQSSNGIAANNSVTIAIGTFNNKVYGGYGKNGAKNNILTINGGTFDNKFVYGGYSNNSSYNAENNIVNVKGGSFNGTAISAGASTGGGTVKGNILNIEGGSFSGAKIYGGYVESGTSSNNELNLKIKMGGKASEVKFFQIMNFTLPTGIQAGEIMLETESVTYDSTKVGVTSDKGVSLKKNDKIYLIKADGGSGEIDTTNLTVLDGAGAVSLEDGKDLVLTLLKDFSTMGGEEDKQKAPVEGIAASVQMVNQSADLASGDGMKSLIAETAGGETNTFAAITTGSSKYKTGSHVDVDGWGFLVGAGKTKEWGNGEATSLGIFFEFGKGDFDTYNGSVHGDGNSENKGIGLMMRHKMMNNTYYEGHIRYGKQETEWGESDIGSYDTDSRYYGISVGIGHVYQVGKNEIDVYGRYTYGHVGACDATVGTKEYHFDSVKSHRVRVGGKYNFKQKNSNAKPYVGLAWEREFKGESKASIAGVGEAPAPSMKGNTGILEVGCDWNVSKKWTVGLGANAYMGKRKGWDGMARVFYNF